MNRFAFLSLYRSLTRHKLYAALNIGGLAVGIAVFIVLALYDRFETGFESWLPRNDQVYLVETNWHFPASPLQGRDASTMGGLLEQLREDFPGTVGTRIRGGASAGTVIRAAGATIEDVAEVDPSFFQVFSLPLLRGDPARALADPSSAIISETAARKYFGDADPVGRSMRISFDSPQTYRVTGVFKDLPKNTELRFSVLIPMPRKAPTSYWYHWGSSTLSTYLRFSSVQEAKAFEEKLPAFVDRRGRQDLGKNPSGSEGLELLPIRQVHLAAFGSDNGSRKITVITLGIVGLLTLLIAVVNYVNLATARAGLRAREVAMRKVLGADRSALIRQFLSEAILTVGIASLAGLILAELGLPLINAAGGLNLSVPYLLVVPGLVVLTLLVGVAAGAYPALLLSKFPAAAVLASSRAPGGGRSGTQVRELLVIFQFGLATAFMIGTFVLVAQTRHVRNTNLGFEREGLIVINSLDDSNIKPEHARALVTAISKLPGVKVIGVSNQVAGGGGSDDFNNVQLPGAAGQGPSLRWIGLGPNFFAAYGLQPIAGRVFDDAHGGDDAGKRAKGTPENIVINRKAVGVLGFKSPQEAIGKTVGGSGPKTIIGVIDDVRFFSPRQATDPTYYLYYPEVNENPLATVRFIGDPRTMLASMRSLWNRMEPQVGFVADTADNGLEKYYEADDRATRLFGIGAGLAVLIGCVGLWGLASFNTARRVKEIGIRKTLGASSMDIVRLLVGQFLRPVLIANVLGWPLAFVAMRTWLAGFDDRIVLSPLYFVGASVVSLAIAVLTVIGQSLRASRAAPAWAMRHE